MSVAWFVTTVLAAALALTLTLKLIDVEALMASVPPVVPVAPAPRSNTTRLLAESQRA